VTNAFNSPIVIKKDGPEALTTQRGRADGEALVEAMESAELDVEYLVFEINDDYIETSASAAASTVERRLNASGLNREGLSEWHVELEAELGAMPPRRRESASSKS
jgi:hypothetical protein